MTVTNPMRRIGYLPIIIILCTTYCMPKTHTDQSRSPKKTPENIIKNRADIDKYAETQALLIGHYRQADIRMRQTGRPVYKGHVSIYLDDQTEVMLLPTWDKDAIREPGEIAKYDGKLVQVRCIVQPYPPNPENFAMAMIPCITKVFSIDEYKN